MSYCRDFEFAQKFGLDVKRVVEPAAAVSSSSNGNGAGAAADAAAASSSSNGDGLPFCEPGVAVASSSSSSGLDISGLSTVEAKDKVGAPKPQTLCPNTRYINLKPLT